SADAIDISIQSRLRDFGRFKSFLDTSVAFQWLVSSINKHLELDMPIPNLMIAITESIRSDLSKGRSSRNLKRRDDFASLSFHLQWDLKDFFDHQEYPMTGLSVLDDILCLTGTPQNAQATTVGEYFAQTWPGSSQPLITLLNRFVVHPQSAPCKHEMSDGSSLTMTQADSRSCIAVTGNIDFIVKTGEQLGWLGCALRSSHLLQGVVGYKPLLSQVDVHYASGSDDSAVCHIEFSIAQQSADPGLPGFCWADMFQNPVVVSGYPIRHRDQKNTGLDIPLETMTELMQSNHVFNLGGNFIMKGYSSLLFATAVARGGVIWHHIFNPDGDRILYNDILPDKISISTTELKLKDLGTFRHIVGWCSNVREYTGHPNAEFAIQGSNLPPFPNSFVVEKAYLGGGSSLNAGVTVSLGKRDKPVRLSKGHGLSRLLAWIYAQPLVFFDVNLRKAWLVDGASALLHLVRASVEQDRYHPAYRSKWRLSGPLQLEGDDALGLGGSRRMTAVEILGNPRNLNIQLYLDDERPDASGSLVEVPYRLRDRVLEILPQLEALVDKQAEVAAQDGYWIPQPSKFLGKTLAGWDFQDVVGPVGPINRRVCHLQAQGHGWIEYVRSIKAITVFGNNFGELLEPDGATPCPKWNTVPEHNDYLSASIGTLKLIHTSANPTGSLESGLITPDIRWLSRAELFSPCRCMTSKDTTPYHHDPVQLLLPCGRNFHLQIPSTCLSITLWNLGDNGAVVFGHTPHKGFSWLKKKRKTDEQSGIESPPAVSCTSLETLESVGEEGSTQFEMSP
ncbi:hypothetical protein EDB81DRAFT_906999, partial [Dactylonectria macrodidyma]